MPDSRIYLSPPSVGELEIQRVVAALESGWVAPLGPEVNAFEADLAHAAGVDHAVALSSGTAAIHLALLGMGVKPGDRVYCPTVTFGATAFAITYTGAQPVFIDSEDETWNLSPDMLSEALKKDAAAGKLPKVIISVDLFGRTCDYDQIIPIADEYGIPVLEDAAEALGATHGTNKAGSFGKAAIFSFNGNKIITSSGGGMLVSNDQDLIDHACFRSTQAREQVPWYEHEQIGFNYRMSNILAALGRAQLSRLDEIIENRQRVHDHYQDHLAGVEGVQVVGDPPWGRSNYWITNIRIDSDLHPDGPHRVRDYLESLNIEARNAWKPMHQQPVFAGAEAHLDGTADRIFDEGLCLPSGIELTNDDVDRIAEFVRVELLS
ncbi:MAG: aminotransferase class I/II-fold pyridoxal phosphate-dependent enzyme [Candidatus Nanopelagicales bacterium]